MERKFYDGLTMATRCCAKNSTHVGTLILSSPLLAVLRFILTAGSEDWLLKAEEK